MIIVMGIVFFPNNVSLNRGEVSFLILNPFHIAIFLFGDIGIDYFTAENKEGVPLNDVWAR